MRQRQVDIKYLVMILELGELWDFNGVQNNEIAINNRLAEIKIKVKKHFKKLAFKYHPDKGGNEEKFKEISAAHDQFQNLRLLKPRPVYRVVHVNMGGSSATTGTSTASWGNGGWYKIKL